MYKIYLTPPARYSEDIDLVQLRTEPIGETLDRARVTLDPWLGEPRRVLKKGRVNLVYRFESEDAPPLKRYIAEEEHRVSRAQFEANLADKRKQPDFRDDVGPLLRPGFSWDFETAMDAVLENLVARLPGDPLIIEIGSFSPCLSVFSESMPDSDAWATLPRHRQPHPQFRNTQHREIAWRACGIRQNLCGESPRRSLRRRRRISYRHRGRGGARLARREEREYIDVFARRATPPGGIHPRSNV